MTAEAYEYTNWIDPDIIAEYNSNDPGFKKEQELEFKEFFEIVWLDPKYDDIRHQWDKLLNDTDPRGRLYGKVALWNLARLRALNDGQPFNIDRTKK